MIRTRHALLPALAVLAVPAASLALAGDLPSPVARHFSGDGNADAAGTLLVLTLLVGGLALLLVLGSLAGVRTAPNRGTARALVAVAHAMGVGLATLHVTTLLAQRGLADWTEAALPLTTVLLALLLPAGAAAALGWWVAADLEVDEADRSLPVEDVEVAPGEAIVWSGRAVAAWAPFAGAALVLLAVVVQVLGGDGPAAAIILAAGVLVAVSGRARVTVGPSGLRVVGGLLPGLPRVAVPLDEVTDVRVERVEVLTYGGIGYRVQPGVRAIITWPGEALSVEGAGGTRTVVTVPGARTAAGVLLAHLAQHRDVTTQP